MATIFSEESRTFSEYLLVPNLTTEANTPDMVDLSAPICKYMKGKEEPKLHINIPMVSAVMQSVSDSGCCRHLYQYQQSEKLQRNKRKHAA